MMTGEVLAALIGAGVGAAIGFLGSLGVLAVQLRAEARRSGRDGRERAWSRFRGASHLVGYWTWALMQAGLTGEYWAGFDSDHARRERAIWIEKHNTSLNHLAEANAQLEMAIGECALAFSDVDAVLAGLRAIDRPRVPQIEPTPRAWENKQAANAWLESERASRRALFNAHFDGPLERCVDLMEAALATREKRF